MPEYPQLAIVPEVPGKRVWRPEVSRGPDRTLSPEEIKLGPTCALPDGIYIVTVSENTPPEYFAAAHLLQRIRVIENGTHSPSFVPLFHYDSAIAVVERRVVGGVVAHTDQVVNSRLVLESGAENPADGEYRPTVMYLWVHPAHRHGGLGRQLLNAIASHLGRQLAQLGFFFPISDSATGLLRSMGVDEVLGFR
jgi:GNAT superfamily N-acetyltransferase